MQLVPVPVIESYGHQTTEVGEELLQMQLEVSTRSLNSNSSDLGILYLLMAEFLQIRGSISTGWRS